MTIIQNKPAFSVSGSAVREAVMELRRLDRGQNVSVHAYTSSAQTLLAALVAEGWTITPPNEKA